MKNFKQTLSVTSLCVYTSIIIARENNAKFGVFGLCSKTINLNYERALNENSSANLNPAFTLSNNLPFRLTPANFTDAIITNEVKTSCCNIAAEYRTYTKGDASRDFYFAPYLLQYSTDSLALSAISIGS